MSRLHPVPARRLIRFLETRGFHVVSQRGSHVKMKDGGGRIVIVCTHSGKDLKIGLLRAILRDAGLDPRDFVR